MYIEKTDNYNRPEYQSSECRTTKLNAKIHNNKYNRMSGAKMINEERKREDTISKEEKNKITT
jgi:hypothetical protein